MGRSEFRETGEFVVRHDYDGRRSEFSELAQTVKPEGEVEHTRQSEADAADINKILKRFERSGILPLNDRQGLYLDVSEVGDYRSALDQVMKVNEYFKTLPAESRAMFDNDPAVFLDKVNGGDLELLVKAGVVPKDEVKPVEPAAPAPPGPA